MPLRYTVARITGCRSTATTARRYRHPAAAPLDLSGRACRWPEDLVFQNSWPLVGISKPWLRKRQPIRRSPR